MSEQPATLQPAAHTLAPAGGSSLLSRQIVADIGNIGLQYRGNPVGFRIKVAECLRRSGFEDKIDAVIGIARQHPDNIGACGQALIRLLINEV